MAEATHAELILASASSARRALLEAAGLAFRVEPSHIDEPALRQKLLLEPDTARPARVASELAFAKARQVSCDHRRTLVIGADQVLNLAGKILPKPREAGEARAMLMELRGRTHHLHTTVALAAAGDIVWSHCETASLTVRPFSEAFLEEYLARLGARVCNSPGGYEIEALGIRLFERIEGDYFGILGLPLLPLLAELRSRGFLTD
ncbi:MAG TPA: nucleoside triphosphate pyrophosphatase [Hyphomicrobiaceae bacterium]|nr:nucleoside triphosphate pyrophosphatase [Hyphomicrobiaceae bacterium]